MGRDPIAPNLVILVASSSILLSALLLMPTQPGESLRIGGSALPNVCLFRQATGLPCPGCGLTRSLVSAMHADWDKSLSHHRLGILILGYLILQSMVRVAWLSLARFRERLAVVCRALDMALVPLLALMVLNWIPTLLTVVTGTAS